MVIFDQSKNSSDQFLQWRISHPDSFVLNIRGNSLMLHRASCGDFDFKEKVTFAPKQAFLNKDDLDDWVRQQNNKTYKVCSDCKT